jgi:ribosomal protein S18 acetylase RimI-like enzyme
MDRAVTIREFTWDDYPAVIALWTAVFGGTKPEDERAALARTVERNPGLFLVADDAGAVVGTVLGAWDGRRAHLYHVAVAPTQHRQGIGRALIAAIAARIWPLGVRTIHLRVAEGNDRAIAFYRSLGFNLDTHVPGMRLNRPEDA